MDDIWELWWMNLHLHTCDNLWQGLVTLVTRRWGWHCCIGIVYVHLVWNLNEMMFLPCRIDRVGKVYEQDSQREEKCRPPTRLWSINSWTKYGNDEGWYCTSTYVRTCDKVWWPWWQGFEVGTIALVSHTYIWWGIWMRWCFFHVGLIKWGRFMDWIANKRRVLIHLLNNNWSTHGQNLGIMMDILHLRVCVKLWQVLIALMLLDEQVVMGWVINESRECNLNIMLSCKIGGI